ncbi:MAG: hypothetical protein JRH13_15010 [Deltaproteobacteria bacterium]|nr:hypothetical protein [Deltaproteobacteria bacterium]MBW2017999.1 hypothetical protein [Deltaproteobacteria bacterium]MBW2130660.1 hypothetical protein [Deltaproteobacteria bacterium]MBW2304676.1 hypothetical protein [Deltaproteobacteria bacterium]
MNNQKAGTLILNMVPSSEAAEKIGAFLSQYVKNTSPDNVTKIIKRAPVVLSKNIPEKVAENIVSKLEKMGASARYVPKDTPTGMPRVKTHPPPLPEKPLTREPTWKNSFLREKLLKSSWR